jgi:hypothetical protein
MPDTLEVAWMSSMIPSSFRSSYGPLFKWQNMAGVLVLTGGAVYLIYRFATAYLKKPPQSPPTPTLPVSPTPSPPTPLTTAISHTTTPLLSSPTQPLTRGSFTPITDATITIAPHAAEPIAQMTLSTWEETAFISYQTIATHNKGVSTSIGMHASLLLPGGNALYHRNVPNLPGCAFMRMRHTPTERIEVCFSDKNFSMRLFKLLETVGLKCLWQEIDLTPEESSFDYYHGAICFDDPVSFLFFTRELCSQGYKQIADYLQARLQEYPTSEFLTKIKSENLQYSSANPTIAAWKEKAVGFQRKAGSIFLPPRMYAPGISGMIGAPTVLLIPGWTSFKAASLQQEIAYVILDEKLGLSLYFPAVVGLQTNSVLKDGAKHAAETDKGLKSIGLEFFYEDLSNKPLNNQFGTYGGRLNTFNPQIIVCYLMRICSLKREEVIEWVKGNKMENTSLGKEIQSQAMRKLEGEKDYSIKIAMKEEEIPLNKLSINLKKLTFHPIPDLPQEVVDIYVKQKLRDAFESVKPHIADFGDGKTVADLKEGIEKIIFVLNGNNYSGVPHDPEEAKKFVQKMAFVLKHIFYLLSHAEAQEKEIKIKETCIAQLAIGGRECAGGHVQAILAVYQALKRFSPLQAHHMGSDADLDLPHVDLVMVNILNQKLEQLRTDIFQALVARYKNQYGGDPAHFKNKVLQAIGKKRAIPGSEMADYLDPYAACAPTLTEQQMLHDFDQEYSIKKILEYLDEVLRYKNKAGVDMKKIVEFLQRHTPVGAEFEDFMSNAVEDDFVHLKRTFIIQILIISGHFSYQT